MDTEKLIETSTKSSDDEHMSSTPAAQEPGHPELRTLQANQQANFGEPKSKHIDTATCLIGVATLLVNIVIATIYYGQLREMQRATQATQDAVRIAGATLTANEKEATRTEEAAGKALQASIDDFQQDQRAWVSVSKIDPVFEVGKPLQFTIHQVNTGKTPAREVAAHVAGEPVSRGGSPSFDLTKMKVVAGYIPPGGEYTGTIDLTKRTGGKVLTQSGMDEILRGDWTPYIRGVTSYKDVWNRVHRLKFCYFLHVEGSSSSSMTACPHVPGRSNPNDGT